MHAAPTLPLESPAGRAAPLRAGTLFYTPATLRRLFVWLLAGDVIFMVGEQIESKVLPVILKSHQATDTQIAIIITTIQAVVTAIAVPIVSYRSDRKRSKWGRRIPYILWGTPLLTLAVAATPFSPEFGHWLDSKPILHDALHWFTASPVIVAFGLIAIIYRTVQIIVISMYFALFRDVVPMTHMGRFLGLFRIFGSLSTFVVTFWMIGLAVEHSRLIFGVVALINLFGFGSICLMVKEGEYPAEKATPSDAEHNSAVRRLGGAIRTFISDAYSDPLIFWTFCARGTAFAATGISSFMIFFPGELGMSLARAGEIISAPTAIWIFIAYPIGRLMDRVGAAPVMSFSLLASTIAYTISFFVVSGPITFTISAIVGGIAFWATLLAQLQLAQEIFPVARYGQLSSANQLQTAFLLTVFITPAVGWTLDTLRRVHLAIPLPWGAPLAVGPYRSVNLMLALVALLSWLCLQKVERLRAARGTAFQAMPA